MVNSVHVTVAAAIVAVVPNPWIALPLALASHVILDTVPHWNWKPGGNGFRVMGSVLDLLVAAGLSVYFASISVVPVTMLIACFLSTVPDLIQGPYYFFNFRPAMLCRFIKWESRRQKWPWCPQWVGVMTQVVTLVGALVIFYR